MEKNIYVLGTTIETGNLIQGLANKFTVSGVITLKSGTNLNNVSGYLNLNDLSSKHKIPVHEIDSYNLKNENDFKLITELRIDILIVYGWQRLIPKWLLEHVSIAVIGVHGSPDGITAGRGRSPQNWALILGAKKFYFSLFQLSEGIDSGNIIASASYPILAEDDIRALYRKLTDISIKLISNFLIDPISFLESAKIQNRIVYYYPKRIPDDGAIDWRSKSESIHNLVKALTKPYPGAFTFYRNQKISIWKTQNILESNSTEKHKPGVIISKKGRNDFRVSTSDGYINILEYDCESLVEIKEGDSLTSHSEYEILSSIIKRHYQTYPNLKISPRLIKYWESLDVWK